MRGHRLVADDVVECDYRPPGMVFGAAGRAAPPPPRGARPRHPQHQGSLRRHRHPRAQAHRRRGPARRVVEGHRVRPPRPRRSLPHDPRREDPRARRSRCGPAATWRRSSRSPRATSCSKNAGHHAAREFFGNLEGALPRRARAAESAAPPPRRPIDAGRVRAARACPARPPSRRAGRRRAPSPRRRSAIRVKPRGPR